MNPITSTTAVEGRAATAWSVELLPDEATALQSAAARITADAGTEPLLFCAQARKEAEFAPKRLLDAAEQFAARGSSNAVLVIAGLAVDDPPPTPLHNREHLAERTLFARMQGIVNSIVGDIIAYEAEGYGRLFQDMVPNPALADRPQSQSSRAELEYHTEQAFSPLRPDWVSLGCLRDDPNAATYMLTARELLAALSPPEVAYLREPNWMTTVDESFRGDHEFVHGDERGPLPIINGPADDPRINVDMDTYYGITQEARALLTTMESIYESAREQHILSPGELLLIDNRRTLHGRSPFIARFDGTDRFVSRSFVVADLHASDYARARDSRVILSRFS